MFLIRKFLRSVVAVYDFIQGYLITNTGDNLVDESSNKITYKGRK